MTTLFPQAEYAEDQSNAKTILSLHVLWRGAPAGVIVALPFATALAIFRKPRTLPNFARQLLVSSSRGTLWGMAISGLMLAGRMWGKEEVEWKDRSWRLLGSKGQVEVDNWILGGAGAGAVAGFVAARRGRLPPGLESRARDAILGGAGLGSVSGTLGYLAWRHGINGGKFPEKK